jgi:hypothetical protein
MFEEESEDYKLFISHINRDDEEYDLFLSKLNASYDFQWKDCAVQGKITPEDIKDQMEPVDVVVILSGLLSKDKSLLIRQIDAAKDLRKPIVVIRPYGMETVPSNLEELASEVVGWNTPCIVDAIRDSFISD